MGDYKKPNVWKDVKEAWDREGRRTESVAKCCAESCVSRYYGYTEIGGWNGIDGALFGSCSISVLLEGVLSRPGWEDG